eukprot:368553-Rhodomonas_salina.1
MAADSRFALKATVFLLSPAQARVKTLSALSRWVQVQRKLTRTPEGHRPAGGVTVQVTRAECFCRVPA